MFPVKPIAILAAAALAISIPTFGQVGDPVIIGPPIALPQIEKEPVLLFDVTGSTFLGSVHVELAVYNNGRMSISKFNEQLFQVPGIDKDVQMAWLTPAEVKTLRRKLAVAGASNLVDSAQLILKVPVSTVTFFKGTTDAAAHTFSYFNASGPYQEVQTVIDDLITTHFPGF